MLNQLVRRDRQITHTFSRRMKNCVRHRGRRADDSDLANPACAEIGHVRVRFVNEIDIEYGRRVRMHGNVVFRQIWIYVAANVFVRNGSFKQSGAETENHSAHDLAARQPGIDHSAHVINADRAFYSYLSEKIDVDLDKNRTVRKERKLFPVFLVWFV